MAHTLIYRHRRCRPQLHHGYNSWHISVWIHADWFENTCN